MTIRLARTSFALIVGASAAGCVNLPKASSFLPGGVDSHSPVAAQVEQAEHASGPYPKFSQIPPMPNDVRPAAGWRATVDDALARKRQADSAVAGYPFSLGDTEGFAAAARSRIPPDVTAAPTADAAKASDDYAAGQRERANPPPPPN